MLKQGLTVNRRLNGIFELFLCSQIFCALSLCLLSVGRNYISWTPLLWLLDIFGQGMGKLGAGGDWEATEKETG